jgi:hypothetical protein
MEEDNDKEEEFYSEVYYIYSLCLCGCGEVRDKATKE